MLISNYNIMNTTKLNLMLVVATCLLTLPFTVNAQSVNVTVEANATTSGGVSPRPNAKPPIGQQFRNERKQILDQSQTQRAHIREGARAELNNLEKGSTTRSDVRELRKDTKDALAANRKMKVEALKENQVKMKAAIDARKRAINAKLLAEQKGKPGVKLQLEAKQKVKAQLGNIFNRLEQHLTKAVEIDAKVAARINTLETEGVNVDAAATQLIKAQAALEKAKADVSAAKALAGEKTATTTPTVSKEAIYSLVNTADMSIKAALVEYRKTVEIIRTGKVETSTTATTTVSTSTTISQ